MPRLIEGINTEESGFQLEGNPNSGEKHPNPKRESEEKFNEERTLKKLL